MKWTTATFVRAFMSNQLGRKRVHGTYRVLEGDHCWVLVKAAVEDGRPAGSTLMAINLQPSKDTLNPLCFWHWHNTSAFSYRMSRGVNGIDTSKWQGLPRKVMSSRDEAILSSGIIEEGPKDLLLEIGDKPYLLHRKRSSDGELEKGYYWIDPVSKRVATIAEAQALTADPDGERNICGEWWAEAQEEGFMPPAFDPDAMKVMSAPMNPLDYGFTMDEVEVQSGGYGSDEIHRLLPKAKLLISKTLTARSARWINDRTKWKEAADTWVKREPSEYMGLSSQVKRYTIGTCPDTRGTILRTAKGVYVTGTLHSVSDWSAVDALGRWYKLTTVSKKLKMSPC
jgi:hypothetical protein